MKLGWRLFAAALVLSCVFSRSSCARTAEETAAFNLGRTVMNDTVYRFDRASSSATSTADPIAIALKVCEGKGNGVSVYDCIQQAYEAYDRLLNQLYKLALAENDEEAGNTLRASERQWLSFQKADYEARTAYGRQEDRRGTVVKWAASMQRVGAIRVRIAELMFFIGADQE